MEGVARNVTLKRGLTLSAVALGLIAGALGVAATGADAQTVPDGPERVYALTTSDDLLFFDGDTPQDTRRIDVNGLRSGDSLVGIDFRPANGVLYGVADGDTVDKIYRINQTTGAATVVSQLKVRLEGTRFGVDFNPTVDRLRIISDTDQNLRVNITTGDVIVDGDLKYAAGDPNAGKNPNATASAYRNSTPAAAGTTNTELYDIDTDTDVMVEQTPPNAGTLVTEGPLGLNAKAITGFDIVTTGASPAGDRGFAILQEKSGFIDSSVFYSINLENGKATRIGRVDGRGTSVDGLAIPIGQR